MRRLIVNADDFGLTVGVNRAIVEAHERGIVTSATLMASAGAFSEAVSMWRSIKEDAKPLSVGCHVVLLDGQPVSPAEQIPSLLQRGASNGNGSLRTALSDFAIAAVTGKIAAAEVEAEVSAQLQRIKSAGVQPSHLDSHKHAHMFPAVLRPLLRAARSLGVRAVRNPFGRLFPLPFGKLLAKTTLWTRFAQMSMLRSFAAKFRAEVQEHGLHTTDGSLGVLVTGVLDADLFSAIVDTIPEGTWEFVCHPGYNDNELDRVNTRLRQSREQELSLLTSGAAKDILSRRGIELISYLDL